MNYLEACRGVVLWIDPLDLERTLSTWHVLNRQ